jgi:hypothetical protein
LDFWFENKPSGNPGPERELEGGQYVFEEEEKRACNKDFSFRNKFLGQKIFLPRLGWLAAEHGAPRQNKLCQVSQAKTGEETLEGHFYIFLLLLLSGLNFLQRTYPTI